MFRWKKRTVDEFIGIALAIFLVSISFLCVRAAQVTGVSDTMSRGKVGTGANHEIVFVTPSGAPEGSTMTVTFPSSFGTSGMTESDVDLFDNGSPVSTAVDCSGIEQAAAVWLGNTLSLQICSGNGGAFAPGGTVTVAIGTNAIDYGVGADRVINPSAAGAYRLTIGGSFGDSGFAPMAIGADDTVGVTACIGDACNVAPPPPPPPVVITPVVGGSSGPGQTPPPAVTGLAVDQITVTTARVSWHSDVASNTYVQYGANTAYGMVSGASDYVVDHSVVLSGLKPGTVYHLSARSMDLFGEVGFSADQTFSTPAVKTSLPPQISDIVLESIGGNEAQISWKTDVPTYWEIDFGRTNNYGNEVNDAVFDTVHATTLGNLTPNALYHFRILAINGNGDQTYSSDQSFTTFDTTPPKVLAVHVENISTNSADIVWQTDKPSTGGVKFGTSPAYENGEVIETVGFATTHRVSLAGLAAGTTYHFGVYQTDRFGNDAQSSDSVFLTKNNATAPLPVVSNKPGGQENLPSTATAIGSGGMIATVNGVPVAITGNSMTAIVNSLIGLALPDTLTTKTIVTVTVIIGTDSYAFAPGSDGVYRVFFNAKLVAGTYSAMILVKYLDGTSAYSQWNINVVSSGIVYEEVNGKQVPLAGAKITVLKNGIVWDGSKYGQNSSQNTANNGVYGFYLPNDNYSLKVEKDGYQTRIFDLPPSSGLINQSFALVKEQPSISKNTLNLLKYSVSTPLCAFPWILLFLIIAYILRRYFKRKIPNNTIK